MGGILTRIVSTGSGLQEGRGSTCAKPIFIRHRKYERGSLVERERRGERIGGISWDGYVDRDAEFRGDKQRVGRLSALPIEGELVAGTRI